MLYGLMTEEINHSYDGGLYAELIRNRAFLDDRARPVHWSLLQEGAGVGEIALDSGRPVNEVLPACLRVNVTATTPDHRVGVALADQCLPRARGGQTQPSHARSRRPGGDDEPRRLSQRPRGT